MNKHQHQEQITVTVWCAVYNQARFVRQCLDGIVNQKTTFKFEAIVHDDASTDGTADIVREYAQKYPHIIKPILETENQYSKRNGSLKRIRRENIRGKYVASCEGDDYWTDFLKLQKQVDILEAHPEVSIVYTGFRTVDSEGNYMFRKVYEDYKSISTSGDILGLLIKGNFIMTLTTCIRRDVFESDIMVKSNTGLDYLLFLAAASMGNAVYLKDETACYRFSPNSEMNANLSKVQSSYIAAKKYFAREFLSSDCLHIPLSRRIALYIDLLENALLFYVNRIDKEFLSILVSKKTGILLLPVAAIRRLIKRRSNG